MFIGCDKDLGLGLYYIYIKQNSNQIRKGIYRLILILL